MDVEVDSLDVVVNAYHSELRKVLPLLIVLAVHVQIHSYLVADEEQNLPVLLDLGEDLLLVALEQSGHANALEVQ